MWFRDLRRREMVGLGLLVVLFASGAVMQGRAEPELPSAEESRRVGWHDPAASQEHARDIFERVNDERVARGSPPLVWDSELADLAQGWSVQMIASGTFEHSPGEYRAVEHFLGTGENIAISHPTTAEVHVGLMESDGHRANILEPDFDALGVGVVCRLDGMLWVTQIFGLEQPRPAGPPVDLSTDPITREDRGLRCP